MKIGDTLRITRQGTRCKHITEGVVQNITKHLVILSAGNYTECFNLAHFVDQKGQEIEQLINGSYQTIKFNGSLNLRDL